MIMIQLYVRNDVMNSQYVDRWIDKLNAIVTVVHNYAVGDSDLIRGSVWVLCVECNTTYTKEMKLE